MSASTDPGHFFQTDASEATRARRAAKSGNKNGNPLKLPSKILSMVVDPHDTSSVYIAESIGCVRKINLTTRNSKTIYRGPAAPVPSVAIGGQGNNTVFGGCWDKDIWSWDATTQVAGTKYRGHSDFVKAVTCARLGGKDILISGGADAKIIIWDTATGAKIHTLRDKLDTMLAIQYLAVDPIESTEDSLVLFSSSSDPQIRRWSIMLDSWSQIFSDATAKSKSSESISAHETSVYSMVFSSSTEAEDSDLWTASADGTAKCLSRARDWAVEETLDHNDYVRAIAISSDFVITAGRSEDVKIWDRNSGKLWHVYAGHYEEVTGLTVIVGESGAHDRVLSASIDGTVRTWSLSKADLDQARNEKKDKENGVEQEVIVLKPLRKNMMTAEELAELDALMDM